MTYKEAQTELEEILRDIENGNIEIDILSEKVKRAGELITWCHKKLKQTEEEVAAILKEFNPESGE